MTKSFDFTTEPQAEESAKEESEDEYEIVPSDSCDDGEWVEMDVQVGVAYKVCKKPANNNFYILVKKNLIFIIMNQ